MNKKVVSKVVMYQRVLAILEENEANWIDKPAYVNAWSSITNNLETIKVHLQLKDKPITGSSIQKKHARETMVKLVDHASNLITAYAFAQDNQTLIVGHNISISKLNKMREAELELRVIRLLNDINDYLSELSDYGLTIAMRDAIAASFNKWINLVVVPRKAINDRKKDGFAIQQLIKSGDALLRNTLDKLMIPFKRTQPNFYFQYRSARMLLETRRHNSDETPSTSDPF